ncbi:hypothetical protein KA344_22355, partial [bacterium]|nr:hypothetical protein [bacterium]
METRVAAKTKLSAKAKLSAKLNLSLTVILLALAVNCQPAKAMLLSGQVEERAEALETNQTPNQNPNQSPLQSQQGRPDLTRANLNRPNQAAQQPSPTKPTTN